MLPALAAMGPMAMSLMGGAGSSMPAWLGPVLGGGMGAGASIFGDMFGASKNQASARAQMAFQERMYRHRYRYTMQDLRKAGVNPMLVTELGGGSAPGGAGYQLNNMFQGLASTAKQIPMDVASMKLMSAQTAESTARTLSALASARDTTAAANLKEKDVPLANLKAHVTEDLTGTLRGFWDNLMRNMSLKAAFGAESSSAKGHKANFDNVESGSSGPRKSFLQEWNEESRKWTDPY